MDAQEQTIDLPIQAIRAYCTYQPIQRLFLFGSLLHGNFNAASDVDLLVEYMHDQRVTLIDMAQQEIELTQLVGRQVDLRTPAELSRHFGEQVVHSALLLYERSAIRQQMTAHGFSTFRKRRVKLCCLPTIRHASH